jgi:hypothetical protein
MELLKTIFVKIGLSVVLYGWAAPGGKLIITYDNSKCHHANQGPEEVVLHCSLLAGITGGCMGVEEGEGRFWRKIALLRCEWCSCGRVY